VGVYVSEDAGPGIYVINLDRSSRRLTEIAERLARIGLAFVRVPGIDGLTLGPPPWEGFRTDLYVLRHGKVPNPREFGCYLSHLAAMRRFLDDGREHALILEDDAEFGDDFPSVLTDAIASADAWDILTLYGNRLGAPMATRRLDGDKRVVGFWLNQTGAVAYLINRAGARACLDTLMPMSLPFDHAFTRSWETGVRFRGLVPYPVSTNRRQSTITRGRRFPHWQRATVFLFRGRTIAQRVVHHLIRDPIWLPPRSSAPRSSTAIW